MSNIQWFTALSCAGGNCIQIAETEDGNVLIGDTKNPTGPTLSYTHDEWTAFLRGAKNGDFDNLSARTA
jgi:hypothetical protein